MKYEISNFMQGNSVVQSCNLKRMNTDMGHEYDMNTHERGT